ncbi:MAG: FAD-dependent monooxygenase, partial [Kutzneria sp.]|nr:FAD-dependent monooxygenase [Kutzneria sp.]
MRDREVPVLIVGGGLTGLSAALFLSQQGVASYLVERHQTTTVLTRASGISPRTMELLRNAGLEKTVMDRAPKLVAGDRWQETDQPADQIPWVVLRTNSIADIKNAVIVEEPSLDVGQVSPLTPHWCGQDRLEPILRDEAVRRGAQIDFNTQFESFEQDENGVSAVVTDRATGEQTRVRAQYMIAADGVRSPIRESLGIGRTGNGLVGAAMSVLFKADLNSIIQGRRFVLCYLANPAAPGALQLFDEERWVFGFFYDPRSTAPEELTEQKCIEIMRTSLGEPDIPIEVQMTMPWEMSHNVADAYRNGRVFLAGDAAHVHPPAGAFGANGGIQDVHNLAWKLAAVLKGWASEVLLASYEQERLPIGTAVAQQAWMRHTFRLDGGDDLRAALINTEVVASGYRYVSDAVLGPAYPTAVPHEFDLTGKPGYRVPHVWLELGGQRVSTVDLAIDSFVLLTGRAAGSWAAAAEQVATEIGVPLLAYVVGTGPLADPNDEIGRA